MSARILKDFDFLAGVHFSDKYYVNAYDIEASFIVESPSIADQNTALERVKYFLYDCLEHSVFIHENDTEAIDKYLNAGMEVCTLPEEPYDQIIAIMLLVKINAITEGKLILTDISLASKMSDGVQCLHSMEENIGPFLNKGWFNEPSTRKTDYDPKSKNKKIVKLSKIKNEWTELDLEYEKNQSKSDADILFATFEKTDK